MRLIAIALILAGAISAQTNCSTPATNPVFIRNEGLTEQVGDLTFVCSGTGGLATIRVALSPGLPVTSAVLSVAGAATSYTEALTLTDSGTAQGTVDPSGTSLTFTNVPVPAVAFPATTTVRITNIRINASGAPLSTGISLPITETIFIYFAGLTSPSLLPPAAVAYTTTGLGPQSIAGVTTSGNAFGAPTSATPASIPACGALTPALPVFFVKFGEAYALAFKQAGSAALNGTVLSWATNNTETGFVPMAFPNTPGASNVANSATRVKLVMTNLPPSATVYVPVTVNTDVAGLGTLTLTGAETGPFSPFPPVAPTAANGLPTGVGAPMLAAIANSGGSATAVYEVTGNSAAVETYSVPVYLAWAVNTVTAGSTPGVSVSFAPTGAPTNIPNFAVTSTTTPLTGPAINACVTSLLFPFVTNQAGFDTLLVLANSSLDNFTANGAAPQSGTCTLGFFGLGAPFPNTGVPSPLPAGSGGSFAPGTSAVFHLSDVAIGFQGYMVAACNFSFAHGSAFVTSNVSPSAATSMGYLALVIARGGGNPADWLGN